MAQTDDRPATETMINFTVRMPTTMRRQNEALTQRDRRMPSDWARVQMERAIHRAMEDDETGDLAHDEVVAEMWARGMITPESEARAAKQTHEDFVRAQEEYEREQQEQEWTGFAVGIIRRE